MAGNDLGSLLGSLLGGGGQGGQGGGAGNILGALLGALGGGGGGQGAGGGAGGGGNPLGGLLDMLTKSGLADQAQSWIGTGENQAVSGAEIAQALPDEALQKAAAQAGVSPEQAADQIAEVLPTAVDKLSPQGQLPTGSLADIIKQQNL
ncbi:YidB family protein [Streptomyces sp. NBC_00249]|uniref:YidB family protein n=1 Tax=Streptomyces sp. NBC_00249 TaxID=2975690 RepID=UPI002256BE2E|nr:YidB family protein [Streptomyces sp. NBC_00249]MCX5197599.1 YidB family protein [Streptomyces sp. NBC_00249]